MNELLPYLTVLLPEDIEKRTKVGDFDRAQALIDQRLDKELPEALKYRLILEKEIIKTLKASYTLNYNQAFDLLTGNLADFTVEEFEDLIDANAIDWHYVNGAIHFRPNIVRNIYKTHPQFASRTKNESVIEDWSILLHETMAELKEKDDLTYRIRMRSTFQVNEEAQQVGELIRVHLPLPIEYAQVENFHILETSHEPAYVNDRDAQARTIYFEKSYEKDETFFVEYEFDNHVRYQELEAEEVSVDQPTFYTEELLPHILFTPYIQTVAEEIVGDETNPLLMARKIYDYVTKNIRYSLVRSYFAITNIPTFALTNFKGDCGVQSLTFITLCRAVGIPARWQSGLYTNPEFLGNHDWAQIFIAPYGWLFVDPSFGGTAYYEEDEELWNFYFGNLDPFRMPAISDFQYDLTPKLSYLREDPYTNQNGEAEYENKKLAGNDLTIVEKIIDIHPL